MSLVHGWDSIKNINGWLYLGYPKKDRNFDNSPNVYSSLGLSTHKHVKCYPTKTKF